MLYTQVYKIGNYCKVMPFELCCALHFHLLISNALKKEQPLKVLVYSYVNKKPDYQPSGRVLGAGRKLPPQTLAPQSFDYYSVCTIKFWLYFFLCIGE